MNQIQSGSQLWSLPTAWLRPSEGIRLLSSIVWSSKVEMGWKECCRLTQQMHETHRKIMQSTVGCSHKCRFE